MIDELHLSKIPGEEAGCLVGPHLIPKSWSGPRTTNPCARFRVLGIRSQARRSGSRYGNMNGSDQPNHTAGRKIVRSSRSEEHTSELQSLMRISYAVFCLKKKKKQVPICHTR